MSNALIAQQNDYFISLDYSPSITSTTINKQPGESTKVSHQALVRIEYGREKMVQPTIGFGFMSLTGSNTEGFLFSQRGIENFRVKRNYFLAPIGLKVNAGGIYILPELGFAFELSHTWKYDEVPRSGDPVAKSVDRKTEGLFLPGFITVGASSKAGKVIVFYGLRAYTSLNTVEENTKYQGVGLQVGVKF